MALITAQSLSVDTRLQAASFELNKTEIIGIIGPNGAGKSTLLHVLSGLEPFTGQLLINDHPFDHLSTNQRAQTIGLLPQEASTVWSLSVSDVVALGRIPWNDEDREIISQAMHLTGTQDLSDRKIDTLSGGERARVWLARVLAGKPQILLADEPIASLDIHYQLAVMGILKRYAQQGHAVMVAIHDLSLAARYCDRICLMKAGKIVALGSIEQVLTEDLLSSAFNVSVQIDLQRSPPIVLPH
ncbi:MAG: ABC transporter ATP-binding protein [Magnetococcales bacterium]|nr:ABC transporter ATP-binding protein [Magnetococcales bacterium]